MKTLTLFMLALLMAPCSLRTSAEEPDPACSLYLTLPKPSTAESRQGGACFGKYYFQFYNSNPCVTVVDMESRLPVQEIKMREAHPQYHCNSVVFGPDYYVEGDAFPLLYASQENAAQHKVLVYRVTGRPGEFALTLVQTIVLPTPSDLVGWYPNILIDREKRKIGILCLGNNPWSPKRDNLVRIRFCRLPELEEGNVTLTADDLETHFEHPDMPTAQGSLISGRTAYCAVGMARQSEIHLFDLEAGGRRMACIPVYRQVDAEIENCFFYDGKLYATFLDGRVYRIGK